MHDPIIMNQRFPTTGINPPHIQPDNSFEELNIAPSSSDDDWEYVLSNTDTTSESDNSQESKELDLPRAATRARARATSRSDTKEEEFEEECSIIRRSESTPEFSSFSSFGNIIQTSDDDISYVLDCNSSSCVVDAQSVSTANNDTVLLTAHYKPTTSSNPMKKVPSFKDMVASNARQLEDEERQKKMGQKALEEKKREDAMKRRKTFKTRLVVTPIKRCARSTGDLRSLVIHEEKEGHSGNGGGGGCNSVIIHEEEEEVLGYSDATEYYNRKAHGSKGRANGLKTRPDEAKRKEMIIHKKNAQRSAQGIGEGKKR